ncbi:MAG: TonB-dependent receptor plug domain-containing protein [Muribaculaceae bacterium]|nr:TonB-dependent receptor plug domain-containing protein [Muribaculaceae bacterium]
MRFYLSIRRMWATVLILLIPLDVLHGQSHEGSDKDTINYELNEIVVEGINGIARDKIGSFSISGTEINKQPAIMGEHDVIKVLQTASGVVAGTEGFAGLYVRGGENDQNLYLIDGLPLLNVYHFGGLFSNFNPISIQRVDFHKGVFPSIFSERGSSIVDITLKKPDLYKTQGSISIGLISGQLYLSTPIRQGKCGISAALRRTWFDMFTYPVLAILNESKKKDGRKSIFNYNFTDFMLKFTASCSKNHNLSFLLFYGKDNFKLGEERFDPEESEDNYQRDLNNMNWGNWGTSLTYQFTTPKGEVKIQPYLSRAFSSSIQENMNNETEGDELTAVCETKPSVLQAGMREMFSFPITDNLEGEVSLQQAWYDYFTGTHSRNALLGASLEFRCNLLNVIDGTLGIRENRYFSNRLKHWSLEPRLSMKIDLPYESSISIGYSRMTQYAQQVSSNYIYLPSDAWLPTASYTKPLQCDIFSLGYFKMCNAGINIKGEVWLKKMQNLAEYSSTPPPYYNSSWSDRLTYGRGTSYGIDLEMEGRYKAITWGVNYGLMWNWRTFPDINNGKRYPAKFDNRHKVDLNMGWVINDRLELTGQWEYISGNRCTLALYNIATPNISYPDAPFVNPLDPGDKQADGIDYYEHRNNVRLPAFHRLNLNISLKGRFNDSLTYKWDFGLYNAYSRMNPFTIKKSYVNLEWSHNGDYRSFKTLSLIPILPSVSFTLNF